MMKTLKMLAATAALTLAGAGVAQAATVEFTFGGAAPTGTTQAYNAGGIDLTVTASGGNITRFSNDAIGVGPNSTFSGTEVEALMKGDETLQFDFNPSVHLIETIVFESRTGTDQLTITNLTDNSSFSYDIVAIADRTGKKDFELDIASIAPSFNRTGDSFLFQVTQTSGKNQGVAIKSISVSAVPVPASLPLLAIGLGAFAYARRRKAA